MNKFITKSVGFSSILLLSACSSGEVKFTMWAFLSLFLLVFVGGAILDVVNKNYVKHQRKGAREAAMAHLPVRKGTGASGRRVSVMPRDMLIDINGRGGIVVDTRNKQVVILRGQGAHIRPTMISYRDVLSSEIIEDGESVTKTSRGSQIGGALIGGLALGGVGAIIGGLSGSSKSFDKISKIALLITINDVKNPVHYVMLLDDDTAHKKSDPAYQNAMGEAQKWHGKLKVVIHQADREDRQQEQKDAGKTVVTVPQESLADELAKLGELRDRGILTEKEFASQKAKLLKA